MCRGQVNPSCCHQTSERSNKGANEQSFFSCVLYKWDIAIVVFDHRIKNSVL